MDCELYGEIVSYLKDKTLPLSYPSTKANFIKSAEKFRINKKGILMKNEKIVVKKEDRELIFQEMHWHSGRDPCWTRIKKR